jgi:16S rRNA (guanine966-N2)-methyltransferase
MAKSKHTIRIISGTHRGRRLPVLDEEGLRPTGDRVREVLFNWLQFEIAGRNILDLFAGTGALGFEAASRGAKFVTMVELSAKVSKQLNTICSEFAFKNVTTFNQSALNFVKSTQQKFDLVFLDPPFSANILDSLTCEVEHLVSKDGFLYREYASQQDLINLPDNWQLYRQKKLGQVKIEVWRKHN